MKHQFRRKVYACQMFSKQLRAARESDQHRLPTNSLVSRPDPSEPVVPYEHAAPDLLYIDIKKLGGIPRPGHRVTGNRRDTVEGACSDDVFVVIDDHARVAFTDNPALPAADQRQGRTIHPVGLAGMGLRLHLSKLSAPRRCHENLATPLQLPRHDDPKKSGRSLTTLFPK